MPYLPAQPDPYDSFSGNPLHSWAKGVSAAEATKAFPGLGTIVQLTVVTRSGGGDWGGRAAKVKITGSKGTLMTTGSTVRSRLGLRSDWFTLVGLMSVDSLGAQVMSGYRSLGGRRVLGAPRGPVSATHGVRNLVLVFRTRPAVLPFRPGWREVLRRSSPGMGVSALLMVGCHVRKLDSPFGLF